MIRSFFMGKYYPMQSDKAHATKEVFRCTTETFQVFSCFQP